MNTNNNSVMVIISMAGTLVAGGGVYLQWLDHQSKASVAVESRQSVSHAARVPAEVMAPVAFAPEQTPAASLPTKPVVVKHPANDKSDDRLALPDTDDDLALPPPSREFDKLDLDKPGL